MVPCKPLSIDCSGCCWHCCMHLMMPCWFHSCAAFLQALEEMIEGRASQSDLRQLAMQQANLAQSINGMAEWLAVRPDTADGVRGTGAAATRFRCAPVRAAVMLARLRYQLCGSRAAVSWPPAPPLTSFQPVAQLFPVCRYVYSCPAGA
jgi:hypothetical protein